MVATPAALLRLCCPVVMLPTCNVLPRWAEGDGKRGELDECPDQRTEKLKCVR